MWFLEVPSKTSTLLLGFGTQAKKMDVRDEDGST